MTAFGKLAALQTKLYLREPIAVFFTLLYGPMMLIIMGIIFGTAPRPELNGLSQMDISVPAYIALIIGITGLTAVPINAATRRETGVLRRFAATPLKPLVYFLADMLAPFVVTLLGILFLILLGLLAYHVRFHGQWLSLLAGICLSMLAFFSVGYAIAGLVPSARVAIILGNVLIIPMSVFSGAFMPLEIMPETVKNISRLMPLTYVVNLLRGLWLGASWGDLLLEIAVLVGMLVVGMIVVALTFKWETT
jgi:ABC-2 type transport system permease protein